MLMIDPSTWSGRDDTNQDPNAKRIHQIVRSFDPEQTTKGWVFIGYACDVGVACNQGRTGAKDGPDAIRRTLGNMAWHSDVSLFDAGNISPEHYKSVEAQQQALSACVHQALMLGHRVIVLGGGHDLSYGSWHGLAQQDPKKSICTVNFDAHFDLRCPQDGANSGTGFYQILQACKTTQHPSDYLCVGIAASANTQDLFKRAAQWGVTYLTDVQCQQCDIGTYLEQATAQHDRIHLSIDLDVLPAEQAPGVSAPAALGVDKQLVFHAVRRLLTTDKIQVIDIAEYNPNFDIDSRTARIAASFIHMVLHKDMYDQNSRASDKITHRY